MKLQLNKKKLKSLSKDTNALPEKITRQIGGGVREPDTEECHTHPYFCGVRASDHCGTWSCGC
ncbi:hypothetical protein [Thalassomonas sp. RHCl1]|uniref:hypothetical protein n=1 Tax=Thalassomonas sp. RHCl1 TaxID=2995320 RepID=UPI00248BB2CF|nr:hypothetical protein [Thalassomonas sp. RHCl1]